jgi:thiamine-phosphate pyrophosphorylase
VLPRIHCITDFGCYDEAALGLLESLVHAGVDGVQVRAKSLTDRDLHDFARSLVDRLASTTARVIVNDRLDVALAAGAHGVHLGLDDLPVAEARRLAPKGFLVGATCRHAGHARRAKTDGADYAGVGPVYASTTKTGLPDPIGLETFAEAAKVLPAVAIAGINADRVPEVMAHGAYGVAAAAALCQAPDPAVAAKELVDAVARP